MICDSNTTKEKEQKGSHSKESTLIDWPNSLTKVPSVSRQQLGTLQMILEQISLPVQYALRTNQSEVSGHVTPKRITSE